VRLDLPLEERNALPCAAGFVPPYSDKGLAADNCSRCAGAGFPSCGQQEPFRDCHRRPLGRPHAQPGVGAPAETPFAIPRDGGRLADTPSRRLPSEGAAQFIVNWDEFAGQLIQILHRDDRQAAGLRRSCRRNHGLSRAVGRMEASATGVGVRSVMMSTLPKGTIVSPSSPLTTLAMPMDAALATDKDRMLFPGRRSKPPRRRDNSQSDETKEMEMQLARASSSTETMNELRALTPASSIIS